MSCPCHLLLADLGAVHCHINQLKKEVTFCQEMEATVARSCQVPNEVVMIKPDHFGCDPETAQTNAFQPQQHYL